MKSLLLSGFRRVILRRFVTIAVLILSFSGTARGEENNLFNSLTAIRYEAFRFGVEAAEVTTTPIDTDGYGLIGTLATVGAVGLTYVFDNDIREKVRTIEGHEVDKAADAGSTLGNPFLHIGLAAVVYGGGILADSPKYTELGEMLGESVLLADATSFVLKQAIGRGRPFKTGDRGKFRPFKFSNDYDSMPSMHTASSFAMASVLSAAADKLLEKIFYYAAASFVGFSRMYKDKHWASDVVLGAAVGELCGRVVMRYHSDHGEERRLALVPAASSEGVSLAVVGNW
jgi:membrane-associated phospholipid phosphatase